MTVKELLKKYSSVEIELLLSYVLGKPKEFLYIDGERGLTRIQAGRLTRMAKRRLSGEPVAYILGYKDFLGLRFKVNKDVLIPRPETEWLVGNVVQALGLPGEKKKQATGLHYRKPTIKILDLGTGSGCIAIALKKVSKVTFDTWASDISQKALEVAKENAKKHGAKIKFIQSDLFTKIDGKFDVIIANLPYVPRKIYDLRLEDLRYEPQGALTDGTRSFQIFRRFFEQVGGHLNPKSLILLEIDPSARKFIQEYQEKYLPSLKIKFHKDFNNFWRYAEIETKK